MLKHFLAFQVISSLTSVPLWSLVMAEMHTLLVQVKPRNETVKLSWGSPPELSSTPETETFRTAARGVPRQLHCLISRSGILLLNNSKYN